MRRGAILLIFLIQFMFASFAFAGTPAMTNGLNYLTSTQNSDGSWGNDGSNADVLPATTAAIETLQVLNQTGASQYPTALSWLQSQDLETTDYLSERIHALSVSGVDSDLLLTYIDQLSKAWGGYDDFQVNNLDTALAIVALTKINYSDQTVINSAISYLLYTQNTDGGWAFYQGDDSNVYMTAIVSWTLQQFPQNTSIATAINKATTYIINQQLTDGSWGTVYETAYAYMALVGVTTDNTVLGNSIAYLTSTQSTNGSWNDDPYSTALALRALYYSENKPVPPPQPTTGSVTGTVIDASTNQPLGGVTVQVSGVGSQGSATATTDSAGHFSLSGIAAGTQEISFSSNGYASSSSTVTVTAGSIINLGTVPLSTSTTSGIIKGTVTDASNGQPLAGAIIEITGSFTGNAVTGSDGSFMLANITPGAVTITASKAGYYPITSPATITAGGILFFNPQLSTTPPTMTTGSLIGKVLNSATGNPMQGTAITLTGGLSANTDATGSFIISDITPNTYQVTISATGYTSQNYQVMIMAGTTTDLQTINLAPTPQVTTVTGRVTDTSTGQPVAGAKVSVASTSLTALTDTAGAYSLSGINSLDFSLKASAAGYNSNISNITTMGYGTYSVDLTLEPNIPGDISITSLSTDSAGYPASAEVTINGIVRNQSLSPIETTIEIEITSKSEQYVLCSPLKETAFVLMPGDNPVEYKWNTGMWKPEDYVITLKVKGNVLLAEKAAVIAILPTRQIGGTISVSPPVTQLDMATPINITADIINKGNIQITQAIRLTITLGQETVYSLMSEPVTLPVNGMKTIDFGQFIPQVAGSYSVMASAADEDIPSAITASLYVGDHVSGTFTVQPVNPFIGNARINGTLSLTGFSSYSGTSEETVSMTLFNAGCQGGNHSGGGSKILTLPSNYSKVTLTRAGFDDNGYIKVNGVEVFSKYNGCCSAEWNELAIDITQYVHEGDNDIYGYVDDCCGFCSWVGASLEVQYGAIVKGDVELTLPDNIELNTADPVPTSQVTDPTGKIIYKWESIQADSTGQDIKLDLTVNNLRAGEVRPVADSASLKFRNTYTNETLTIPIEIPSVTGKSLVSLDVLTDKMTYSANEDVNITAFLTNISPDTSTPALKLTIEDVEGNIVQDMGDVQSGTLNPPYTTPFLEGWLSRVKLTVDRAKINEDLTDFPVRVHLSTASGLNKADISAIFSELGANSKKMAVTTSDGKTQCFVEIDKWDAVNNEADLWVKVPSISSTADTILYLYYGSTQDDNIPYIGDVNSIAAKNVWNTNYKAVYHMSQDPSGSTPLIWDSTGNNNGTAYGSMTSDDSVNGQIGKGIDFDGSNDYVNIGKPVPANLQIPQAITIEAWIKPNAYSNAAGEIIGGIVASQYDPDHAGYSIALEHRGAAHGGIQGGIHFQIGSAAGYWTTATEGTTPVAAPIGQWTHVAAVAEPNSKYKVYFNGELVADWTPKSGPITYGANNRIALGWNDHYPGGNRYFNGGIDEVAISSIAHSPAWVKATYHSQSDNLISFGIRESALDIDPASKQTYNFTWNTGTTFAGDYIVRAKLYENGIFLTEDTASFAILPGKSLNTKISTDKIAYNPNEQVAITSAITSTSPNYIFLNLTAKTAISYQQSVIYTETKAMPILAPNQIIDTKTYWNASINPQGTYTITLEVFEGIALLRSSTATFEILGSTATGSGLSGTISSQPSPVNKGNDETLTLTITNSGNEDITSLNAKVMIVNPDTQEVKAEYTSQYPITRGGTITETRTVSTASLSPGNYLAILQASTAVMTQAKPLASASFEVKEVAAGIEASKTMPDVTNLLVWVNDKESCQHSVFNHQHRKNSNSDRKCEGHNEDNEDNNDNEDHGKKKDCIRLDLLENILKEAAADYMIVHDKKDFQREIRNPYYTDIVILGDHHNLEDHYGEELREKVYSGTGLITSQWHKHNKDWCQVFETGCQGKDRKDDKDNGPSVVNGEYGNGRTVNFGFDIAERLNEESYEQISAILKNAIAYIHKPVDTTIFRPNQLVPVEIMLKSLGGSFDLRVIETYPAELKLYTPSNSNWITDNPWITNIHLEADETKTLPYFVLSPDKAGAYTLQTEVGYMDNGIYTFYQNLNADITVDKDAATLANDIIAALDALTVTGKDKAKVRDAEKHIEKVRNRDIDDKKDIAKNIHYILKAIESLLYIKSADVSNIRLMMDGLLRVLEGRYYLLNAR